MALFSLSFSLRFGSFLKRILDVSFLTRLSLLCWISLLFLALRGLKYVLFGAFSPSFQALWELRKETNPHFCVGCGVSLGFPHKTSWRVRHQLSLLRLLRSLPPLSPLPSGALHCSSCSPHPEGREGCGQARVDLPLSSLSRTLNST